MTTNSEHIGWARSDEGCSYRRQALEAVQDALRRRVGPSSKLLGSWGSDEFHLSAGGAWTFSDVDVFDPLHHEHEETTWVLTRNGWSLALRVSVHPEDYERTLRPQGRLALALLNLGTATRRPAAEAAYVKAKAFLVLSSHGETPSYREMAATSSFGAFALAVKLAGDGVEPMGPPNGFDVALDRAVNDAYEQLSVQRDLLQLLAVLAKPVTGMSSTFAAYLTTKFLKSEG